MRSVRGEDGTVPQYQQASEPDRMNAILEIPVVPARNIVLNPPLSDEEFERLSETCRSASLERSKEGTIIFNAPAGGTTSDGNSEINQQLRSWWKTHRRGRVFDSSAGFFLPDGSVLSPDAAYLTAEQVEGLTREDLSRFPRLAPAFVIELLPASDNLSAATQKIAAWLGNGVELGWLIDPFVRQVHIYERGAAPRVEAGKNLAASGPVIGFELDLKEVWSRYD